MTALAWNHPDAFELRMTPVVPEYPHRSLEKRAQRVSALPTRVMDWIASAPIMLCVLNDDRYFQGLYECASRSGSLKDALRLLDIPTPLRKIPAAEIGPWAKYSGWRQVLQLLHPSDVARKITDQDQVPNWLRNISWILKSRAASRFSPGDEEWLRWVACVSYEHSDPRYGKGDGPSIASMIDLINSGERYSFAWSPNRWETEHAAWVARLKAESEALAVIETVRRTEAEAKRMARLEEEIDISPAPASFDVGDVNCSAIVSARGLLNEGASMRHCVGDAQFQTALMRRKSLFYHLSICGEVSTLELRKSRQWWEISQHCGRCNARPHQMLCDAAVALVAEVNECVKADAEETVM